MNLMKLDYSYTFIKNINESLYKRFDDFIRLCLLSDDSNYIFISSTSSLFELAFKQLLYSTNKLFTFFNYTDPNLYEMISGDSLSYLEDHFDIDFNVIHKYRIESNSSRHDIYPTVPTQDRFEIVKNLFRVYVELNNELAQTKVKYPSDNYVRYICSQKKDVVREINEQNIQLDEINKKIKTEEERLSKYKEIIDEKEEQSNNLLKEVERLDALILSKQEEIQFEQANIASELKNRAFKKLIEKDFSRAVFLFENAIKQNILDYEAYIGYFLASNKSSNVDELILYPIVDITVLKLYEQAIDVLEKEDKDKLSIIGNKVHLQFLYLTATNLFNSQLFNDASIVFSRIKDYRDSADKIGECEKGIVYLNAIDWFYKSNYEESLKLFESITPFLNSDYFIELNKDALRSISKKEKVLEKRRLLMEADYLFSKLMFDEAKALYLKLGDEEKVKAVAHYKSIYDIFVKFINFEPGGEKIYELNQNDEAFIDISRHFPGCFEERKEKLFSFYSDRFQSYLDIDLLKVIDEIENNVVLGERNIAISALFFTIFSRPFNHIDDQLAAFLNDESKKNNYFNIMLEEYSKSEFRSRVIEEN